MYERIIEIIVFVLSELKQKKKLADVDIKELENRGYTDVEISTAFSWLVDRLEFSHQFRNFEADGSENSFRILHQAEQDLFTQEAYRELIQLHSLGIINSRHIETIMERALMIGMREIDSHQLKSFVAMAIFNAQDDYPTANRYMLNGDDTIH